MAKQITYKFSEAFLPQMSSIILNRMSRCNIDLFDIVYRMSHHVQTMGFTDNEQEQCQECGEIHSDPVVASIAVRKFYADLALLTKFLYPIMEQLQATVDHNTVGVYEKEI